MSKSYREDNRPAFQFYPDDWLKEPALRLCSLAARGLWMDMLCIMWFGQPRGTLTANGKQIDNKGLAKLASGPTSKVNTLMQELESNNVFSRLEDGTIYCRRMYKQWQGTKYLSEVRSRAGKKGMASRWKKGHSKGITEIAASSSSSLTTSTSEILDLLYREYKDAYNDAYQQPYVGSTSGKEEKRHISELYKRFNNVELWSQYSKDQVDHCTKLIRLFFEEGKRRRWDISLRNLCSKAHRLQLILTRGDDGVFRELTDEERVRDENILREACAELEKSCDRRRILRWLEKLPEYLHNDLRLFLSKTYPEGHSYTAAKDVYEKAAKSSCMSKLDIGDRTG